MEQWIRTATDYKIVVVPDTGGTRCMVECPQCLGLQLLCAKYPTQVRFNPDLWFMQFAQLDMHAYVGHKRTMNIIIASQKLLRTRPCPLVLDL